MPSQSRAPGIVAVLAGPELVALQGRFKARRLCLDVAAGQQAAFEPAIARVFAQHFEHAAVGTPVAARPSFAPDPIDIAMMESLKLLDGKLETVRMFNRRLGKCIVNALQAGRNTCHTP